MSKRIFLTVELEVMDGGTQRVSVSTPQTGDGEDKKEHPKASDNSCYVSSADEPRTVRNTDPLSYAVGHLLYAKRSQLFAVAEPYLEVTDDALLRAIADSNLDSDVADEIRRRLNL